MVDVEDDMTSLFFDADEEASSPPKKGDTITGTVVEMDDNGALLQITGKMSAYLPIKEAALLPLKHVSEVVEIGQEITAEVVGTLRGMPVFSLRSAQLIQAWADIMKVKEADEIFEVKVTEVNKGGAVCAAFGLKAFLPGSHYLGMPDESLIGTMINVRPTFLTCLYVYMLPFPFPLFLLLSSSFFFFLLLSSSFFFFFFFFFLRNHTSNNLKHPSTPTYPNIPLHTHPPLQVKFLDVVAEEGKLVLSQRRALAESQVELTKGTVIKGTSQTHVS